jgi:hypothetical protein
MVRMPDAEAVGLGFFNSWAGHLGTWGFSWGRSQRKCTAAKSEDLGFFLGEVTEKLYSCKIRGHSADALASQSWLECVDDKLSVLVVKSLSRRWVFFYPEAKFAGLLRRG